MNKSPQQIQTPKTANKLFVLCIQDEDGKIQRILTDNNYDQLWLVGVTESKSMRGFWTIFDLDGRAIDGNFRPQNISR